MATIVYLASALVMGVLLLGTLLALARAADQSVPFVRAESGGLTESLSGPTGWILGFVLLVAGAIGGAVAFVGGFGIGSSVGSTALVAVLLAGLFGYVLFGTYTMARSRGLPSAHAAGVSMWAGGAVVVLGIAVKLVAA